MHAFDKIGSLESTKKVASFVDEFKNFAFKGNVVDLAVAVVVGSAFGKIVDSLVKQIIMPLISAILPVGGGYMEWKWVIDNKEIRYGEFLGELINFLVVTLAMFLFIVKFLGWLTRSAKEEAALPAPLTKEQELLMEIRDLLKNSPSRQPDAAAAASTGPANQPA